MNCSSTVDEQFLYFIKLLFISIFNFFNINYSFHTFIPINSLPIYLQGMRVSLNIREGEVLC